MRDKFHKVLQNFQSVVDEATWLDAPTDVGLFVPLLAEVNSPLGHCSFKAVIAKPPSHARLDKISRVNARNDMHHIADLRDASKSFECVLNWLNSKVSFSFWVGVKNGIFTAIDNEMIVVDDTAPIGCENRGFQVVVLSVECFVTD
jgi:hypothetical protein